MPVWGYLLAFRFISPNHGENFIDQFHEHTQKDKRGYNSMYMTQSLIEKAEDGMVVSSLMRARPAKKE